MRSLVTASAALLMLLTAAGCGGNASLNAKSEIEEGHDDRVEGPGLFSGEDGVFTIYRGGGSVQEQPSDGPVKVERRRR